MVYWCGSVFVQDWGLYQEYNNKFMIVAAQDRQEYTEPRHRPYQQYEKLGPAYHTISEDSQSISIFVNQKHLPNDGDSQNAERTQMKKKRPELTTTLFADNNFRAQAKVPSQGHSSFLQKLRNLSRKTYEPSNIKVLLKTEYSVIHNLIHKYFNYKFYNKEDQYNDIFLIWIDSYVSEEFVKRLKSYQRINHFPSSCELGRKDLLASNLNFAKSCMPQLYQFYPKTWVLPKEYEAFSQRETSSFYIVKPHANCQGRGIYLSKNPNLTTKDEVIVQEYVENPMLIDGCKFDLRVYVMVRSLDPLRIYVYEEGLCRLATSKYSKPNENNFRNDKMHLTNYAINKFAPNFIANSDIKQDNKGHKRSLTSAMKTLSEMGFNTSKIMQRIDSIIIRSILAAYTKMLQSYKKTRESNINFKYMKEFLNFKEEHKYFANDNSNEESVCFQVLGFDIMLLETGQPILLEINHQPSLVTDSPLDLNIKKCLIMDTINILNIDEEDRNLWQKNQNDTNPYKHTHVEEKQLQNKGGYRRVYPLSHIKLHEKSQEEAAEIKKYIQLYEGMINRIMFREFKRLSKLKMINYKTITSRNNRTHQSKFSQEDNNRTNTSAPKSSEAKNSKYHNQKSVALTFYNLFNNSKYHITRAAFKKTPEQQSQAELEQTIIKNHVFLQSIEKANKIKKDAESVQPYVTRRPDQLVDLKAKSRREEFYMRKQQAISSKLPDFFVERDMKYFQEPAMNEIDKSSKNMRLDLLSNKNKGIIHYISTNKSKKQLQQRRKNAERGELIGNFSSVGNKSTDPALMSQRSSSKTRQQQNNPQVNNRLKTSEKRRGEPDSMQNESNYEYKQIYGNSIRQKMEKINNLKIIKSNLHKLNFINFVERTKGVRKIIGSIQTGSEQKTLAARQ